MLTRTPGMVDTTARFRPFHRPSHMSDAACARSAFGTACVSLLCAIRGVHGSLRLPYADM